MVTATTTSGAPAGLATSLFRATQSFQADRQLAGDGQIPASPGSPAAATNRTDINGNPQPLVLGTTPRQDSSRPTPTAAKGQSQGNNTNDVQAGQAQTDQSFKNKTADSTAVPASQGIFAQMMAGMLAVAQQPSTQVSTQVADAVEAAGQQTGPVTNVLPTAGPAASRFAPAALGAAMTPAAVPTNTQPSAGQQEPAVSQAAPVGPQPPDQPMPQLASLAMQAISGAAQATAAVTQVNSPAGSDAKPTAKSGLSPVRGQPTGQAASAGAAVAAVPVTPDPTPVNPFLSALKQVLQPQQDNASTSAGPSSGTAAASSQSTAAGPQSAQTPTIDQSAGRPFAASGPGLRQATEHALAQADSVASAATLFQQAQSSVAANIAATAPGHDSDGKVDSTSSAAAQGPLAAASIMQHTASGAAANTAATAPAPAAAANAGVADRSAITDQIVAHFTPSTADNGGQMVIHLNPPELGSVRLSFQSDAGGLKCSVVVDNPQTLDAVRHEAPALMQRLADSGVQIRQIDVGLSHSDASGAGYSMSSGSGFQQHYQQGGWNQSPWRQDVPWERADSLVSGVADALPAGGYTSRQTASGGSANGINVWM
jgi:flagellar hook-length control protein FliK